MKLYIIDSKAIQSYNEFKLLAEKLAKGDNVVHLICRDSKANHQIHKTIENLKVGKEKFILHALNTSDIESQIKNLISETLSSQVAIKNIHIIAPNAYDFDKVYQLQFTYSVEKFEITRDRTINRLMANLGLVKPNKKKIFIFHMNAVQHRHIDSLERFIRKANLLGHEFILINDESFKVSDGIFHVDIKGKDLLAARVSEAAIETLDTTDDGAGNGFILFDDKSFKLESDIHEVELYQKKLFVLKMSAIKPEWLESLQAFIDKPQSSNDKLAYLVETKIDKQFIIVDDDDHPLKKQFVLTNQKKGGVHVGGFKSVLTSNSEMSAFISAIAKQCIDEITNKSRDSIIETMVGGKKLSIIKMSSVDGFEEFEEDVESALKDNRIVVLINNGSPRTKEFVEFVKQKQGVYESTSEKLIQDHPDLVNSFLSVNFADAFGEITNKSRDSIIETMVVGKKLSIIKMSSVDGFEEFEANVESALKDNRIVVLINNGSPRTKEFVEFVKQKKDVYESTSEKLIQDHPDLVNSLLSATNRADAFYNSKKAHAQTKNDFVARICQLKGVVEKKIDKSAKDSAGHVLTYDQHLEQFIQEMEDHQQPVKADRQAGDAHNNKGSYVSLTVNADEDSKLLADQVRIDMPIAVDSDHPITEYSDRNVFLLNSNEKDIKDWINSGRGYGLLGVTHDVITTIETIVLDSSVEKDNSNRKKLLEDKLKLQIKDSEAEFATKQDEFIQHFKNLQPDSNSISGLVFRVAVSGVIGASGAIYNVFFSNSFVKTFITDHELALLYSQISSGSVNAIINAISVDQLIILLKDRFPQLVESLFTQTRDNYDIEIPRWKIGLILLAVVMVNVGAFFSNYQVAVEAGQDLEKETGSKILNILSLVAQIAASTALVIRSTLNKVFPYLVEDKVSPELRYRVLANLNNCLPANERLTRDELQALARGQNISNRQEYNLIQHSIEGFLVSFIALYGGATGKSAFEAAMRLVGDVTLGGFSAGTSAAAKFWLLKGSANISAKNITDLIATAYGEKKFLVDPNEANALVKIFGAGFTGALALGSLAGPSWLMSEYFWTGLFVSQVSNAVASGVTGSLSGGTINVNDASEAMNNWVVNPLFNKYRNRQANLKNVSYKDLIKGEMERIRKTPGYMLNLTFTATLYDRATMMISDKSVAEIHGLQQNIYKSSGAILNREYHDFVNSCKKIHAAVESGRVDFLNRTYRVMRGSNDLSDVVSDEHYSDTESQPGSPQGFDGRNGKGIRVTTSRSDLSVGLQRRGHKSSSALARDMDTLMREVNKDQKQEVTSDKQDDPAKMRTKLESGESADFTV